MTIATAATAAQTLNNALAILKQLRERSLSSKDNDLKNRISELWDAVLSMKEAVMRVSEENTALRARLDELTQPPKFELRQVGAVYYYFKPQGQIPYCRYCYDTASKEFVLEPAFDSIGGRLRKCIVCNKAFYETTKPPFDNADVSYNGDAWLR